MEEVFVWSKKMILVAAKFLKPKYTGLLANIISHHFEEKKRIPML